jgi:hypothetical protein
MVNIRDAGKTVFKISVDTDSEEALNNLRRIGENTTFKEVFSRISTAAEDGVLNISAEIAGGQEVAE